MGKDVEAVTLLIDKKNGFAEIEGEKSLKEIMFEVSSYVLKRWKSMNEKKPSEEPKMPEGAKWQLLFLPPEGIDGLTYTTLLPLWVPVMAIVNSDRGVRMRYGSQR